MNQTNNRIREEWREQIEIWKDTPSPENEGEATEIVTNWWLSKIDELLKSQREELVEKIKNYKPHIGEDGLLRRKGLLDNLSPNKENKEFNNSSVKIDQPKPPFTGLHYQC